MNLFLMFIFIFAFIFRFLDRFAVLQPSRLQDWKGPDKEGAKEVLKLLKSKMGDALPKEEVQLGRTMVFIRKPETYFGIEQIRERVIAEYVSKIQRAWREFSHRKEFIVLQIAMTKLYNASDRQRRRESIMRPFKGDYMTFLPGRLGVVINDGVRRILSFYSKEEHVMFSDVFVYQVVGTPKAPHWAYAKRILVMTNVAIYLMEYWSPEYKKVVFPKKELPDVILRRRINIGEVKLNSPGPRPAELEMVMMSTQADPILALLIKPVERIKEYYSPSWPEKNSAKQCAQTGKSFGMFEWKKRCKVSGNIFVDAVCDFEQSVPDYGFYQPDRIGDKSIGLASCDQPEDIILHIDKKTEFVGLLATQWKRLRGQRPPVKFSNEISLRCGPEPSISTRPAAQLQFVKMTSAPAPKTIKVTAKLVNTKELVGELDTSSKIIRFSVAPGVSLDMAERRRVRQEEKRRIAELQRTRLAEERKQRNAERSVEREKERMIRIAEKKARKVAEKEAKKAGTGAKKGGLPINKDMASMSVAPPPPRPTLRAPPPVVQAARGPPGQAGGPRGPPMMMGGGPRGPPPPPPPPPPRPMGRPPVFTPPPAPVSAAEEDQDDEYAPAPRVPPSRGSMFGANPYNAPPPRPPMARPPPSASPFSPEQSPRDSGSAPNLNRLSFSLPSRGDSPAPPRPPVRPMVPSPRQDDEDDDDEDYTPPPVMSPPRGPPRGPPPRGPPPQQQQQFQPPPMAPRPAFAPQSGAPRPSGSGPPPGALPPGAPPMPRGMPPRPMPSRPPPRPPGQ